MDAEKMKQEAAALRQSLPQGEPVPDAVVEQWAKGQPLTQAYRAHQEAARKQEAERLRRENEVLRSNAEAARRAPVRETQGGGIRPEKADFLKGFDEKQW